MTRAEIYRKAAELCDAEMPGWNRYSCLAIGFVSTGDYERTPPTVKNYVKSFSPEGESDLEGAWGEKWPHPQSCRVLALCFAAALAETGDL